MSTNTAGDCVPKILAPSSFFHPGRGLPTEAVGEMKIGPLIVKYAGALDAFGDMDPRDVSILSWRIDGYPFPVVAGQKLSLWNHDHLCRLAFEAMQWAKSSDGETVEYYIANNRDKAIEENRS